MALQRHKLLGVEEAVGNGLGVLHGIPIVVKDCIDTDARYGMPTSAGNFALGEVYASVPRLDRYAVYQAPRLIWRKALMAGTDQQLRVWYRETQR